VNVADGGFDQLKPIAVPGVRYCRQSGRGNCKENPGGSVGAFFHVFLLSQKCYREAR
jgi:hypothetical protein